MDEQLIRTIKRAQSLADSHKEVYYVTEVRGRYVATSFISDVDQALEIVHPVSDTSWKFNKF